MGKKTKLAPLEKWQRKLKLVLRQAQLPIHRSVNVVEPKGKENGKMKNKGHTSTTLGNQNMKGSQGMVSMVEPYELPEGWKWESAKNIADIYTGNSINEKIKQEKYFGQKEGLNFIGTKDVDFGGLINYENGVKITDSENFKVAPANTSLLCIEGGSAGKKLGFTEEQVCFGNKLCAFVCKNVVPKLIFYYL